MTSDSQFAAVDTVASSGIKASYRILEVVEDRMGDDRLEDLKKRLYYALGDFDALAGETITVGRLHENADAIGRAHSHNRLVEFPTDADTSNVTLYHELGHVAIRVRNEADADLPKTSEEFCSIYSMAHMPTARVDEDYVPYLGDPDVSRGLYPTICQRALEYREDHHNYIQKCKEWLGI